MSEEDFLTDSAALLYGEAAPDDGTIRYGPLTLTVAPKVCFRQFPYNSGHLTERAYEGKVSNANDIDRQTLIIV